MSTAEPFVSGSFQEAINGRLQTQQPIYFNAQVRLEMGEWRRRTIEDKEIPDDRKFGTLLSSGRGDQFDLLHLSPFDPSFYYDQQTRTHELDNYVETRINVFQSLNGLEIPRDVGASQEAFEDLFLYAGQPNRAIYFGKPGQPATGVAMMVAGSKNCWNYGHDTWYPGDKLCWRMPSIDSVKREEERKKLPSDREHPATRDRAIIEVLTFDKAHYFLREGLVRSLDSTPDTTNKYGFTRLLPNSDEHLSSTDRSIIALRNFLQLHSFHTIAMMMAYGLSPERVPGDGKDPLDASHYNANVGLERLDLSAVLKKKVVPHADGTIGVPAEDMQPAELEKFANKLVYWAGKFGLLGPSAPEYVRPFVHLVNQTIGLTMRPWILNKLTHNYFSILRFFPDSMKQNAVLQSRNSGFPLSSYNLGHQLGALAYCQSSLAKDFSAAIGFAIEKKLARVMFTSLNMTKPGSYGDTYR